VTYYWLLFLPRVCPPQVHRRVADLHLYNLSFPSCEKPDSILSFQRPAYGYPTNFFCLEWQSNRIERPLSNSRQPAGQPSPAFFATVGTKFFYFRDAASALHPVNGTLLPSALRPHPPLTNTLFPRPGNRPRDFPAHGPF